MVKLVKIVPSAKADKKYDAHFITDANRTKVVSFGAAGMGDFRTLTDERRQAYITRHKGNEDWSSPMTAGALSYYVLWTSKTLRGGIANYKKRFNL